VINLGENTQDVASMQALMKIKYTKIHILKKKFKIHRVDHVQIPDLQTMQQEKYMLQKQIVQMKYQMEICENQIESLKRGSSSSQSIEPTNPFAELAKTFSKLSIKGVEIEKLKKSISTQTDEIKAFRE